MSDPSIRALSDADIKESASLHRRAFPGFFLSELGEPFLREFYRGFLDPGAVAFTARDPSGRLCGVVVGHSQPGRFFRRLLVRRWYAFAWASLALALRRPSLVPRLVRAIGYRGQTPVNTDGALLSSICVDTELQGRGVGQQLIHAWTRELTIRGVRVAYLTTDAVDNAGANAFYLSAGWIHNGAFRTQEGRLMNCYAWHDVPTKGEP